MKHSLVEVRLLSQSTLPRSSSRRRRRWSLPTLADILWAILGLELTLIGTLVHLAIPNQLPQHLSWQWPLIMTWQWEAAYSFSLQVAAVLWTAAVGGPTAGILAQLAYVGLGLWKYPVFFGGGGTEYWHNPALGYLLGFIPAAWITGSLAFRQKSNLNWLASSCLAGLLIIHGFGIVGLAVHYGWSPQLVQALGLFSLLPLLGQLIGVLGASSCAWLVRRIFFT